MSVVPRVRTPIPLEDLAGGLVAGFHDAFGYEPTPEAVGLAFAQLCFEAGVAGGLLRAVWDNNLGNHDATAAERASGPTFVTVLERELDAAGHEYHATHIRPAYEDLEAGATGYWRRLAEGFSDAFYTMPSGDPEAFARALKAHEYFTDTVAAYAAGLRRWLADYQRRAAGPGPTSAS